MKIAICLLEKGNERMISQSLTEANYFLIFDSEKADLPIKVFNSHSANIGSEIFCSQLLISKGVNKVICGNCEPDAEKLFKEAKIEVDKNFKPYLNMLLSEITDETNLIVH